MKEVLKEPTYAEEVLALLRSNLSGKQLLEKLSDYHENDIAGALEQLTGEEREKLYPILGEQLISDIFCYIENPDEYLAELELESAARVLSYMDADDAADILGELA